jgi:uncharacterized protein YozE (UPF0346 family)
MTLIEFLKSQSTKDNAIGDIARDVMRDKSFPIERSEEGMISYLEFNTRKAGEPEVFDQMIAAYQQQEKDITDPTDLDVNFSVQRSEQWQYYKKHFKSDRAVIVGNPGDIYRVFAIDSTGKTALRFDIYTTRSLNDLSIVSLDQINNGALTRNVTIESHRRTTW